MRVGDIMTRDVIGVAPDATIDMVARIFADEGISGVPVLSADGRPLGLVTQADLTARNRAGSTARDIMNPRALCIEANALLTDAADRLLSEGIHRLLVVDGQHVVGIVTATDLVRGFARSAR